MENKTTGSLVLSLCVLFAGTTCMAAQYKVTSHSATPALCLPYYNQNVPNLKVGDVVDVDWSNGGVTVHSDAQGLTGYYPVGEHPFDGENLGTTTNEFVNPYKLVITYDIGPGTNIATGGFLSKSGNQLIVNSVFSECELTLK